MYSRCAFCTLVMLDNRYAQGAIVLAKSLLESKTACPNFICMVTADIDKPTRDALSVYWQLVDVDYITVKTHQLRTKRMDFLYKKWINYACTKWNFLNLLDRTNHYEQMMYIDADSCVLQNIDHLFFRDDPTRLSSGYQAKLCLFSCFQTINARILRNELTRVIEAKEREYYQNNAANLTIPVEWLNQVWTTSISGERRHQFLMSGAVTVWRKTTTTLSSTGIFDVVVKHATDDNNVIFSGNRGFFYNGWDEQILIQAILEMQNEIAITHLPLRYCWTSGFYHALPANVQPHVMTFWGLKKPWYFDKTIPVQYMDVYIWRYFSSLR